MVAKRNTKPSTGKKLKLKKETMKDLSVDDESSKVKGGLSLAEICHSPAALKRN